MSILLRIQDKTGRVIYLTQERWRHIILKHPEISGRIEDIKQTLLFPQFLKEHIYHNNLYFYCTYYKQQEVYLIVLVKYLNGKGFIVTSYTSNKAP